MKWEGRGGGAFWVVGLPGGEGDSWDAPVEAASGGGEPHERPNGKSRPDDAEHAESTRPSIEAEALARLMPGWMAGYIPPARQLSLSDGEPDGDAVALAAGGAEEDEPSELVSEGATEPAAETSVSPADEPADAGAAAIEEGLDDAAGVAPTEPAVEA